MDLSNEDKEALLNEMQEACASYLRHFNEHGPDVGELKEDFDAVIRIAMKALYRQIIPPETGL